MINSSFPSMPISVRVMGVTHGGIALLDTGFEGDVIIPADLSPRFAGQVQDLVLADGSPADALIVSGYVQLPGFEFIPADVMFLAHEYVIGMGILRRYEVVLDHGQRVIINP